MENPTSGTTFRMYRNGRAGTKFRSLESIGDRRNTKGHMEMMLENLAFQAGAQKMRK